MKTLKLSVIHRVVLMGVLNSEQSGHNLSELNQMLKIVDKLGIKLEEQKKLNLRIEDGAWKWETADADGNEIDTEQDFEMSDDQTDVLVKILNKKNEEKAFALNNAKPIIDIFEQLEIQL